MNGAPGMLTTAAAFRGEFKKMLLALAIVLAILLAIWAIEQWRASGWRDVLPGWVLPIAAGTLVSLGLGVGLIVGLLFALGLI